MNCFLGGARESDIIKEALALGPSLPHEHIIQTLADLSTCIKLGNCELPIKHFKYVICPAFKCPLYLRIVCCDGMQTKSCMSLDHYSLNLVIIFTFSSVFNRAIMKLLLELLDSQQTDIVLAVIHTLSKILRSERMKSSWCNFLELTLLKIIDCYKTHKDVC